MDRFYSVVALGAFLLGLLSGLLGYGVPHALPWFMIATAIAASLYGLGMGLGVAGAASLVLLRLPGFDLVAVALLLSALLAHQVGKSLRRAYRKARAQRLLADALEALPKARFPEEVLKSLPERLHTLGGGGHVGVWVPTPRGFRLLASRPPLSLEEIPGSGVVG
ncbi:hypothetical protein GCM10007092_18610 [Thermus composti]|nr:hypothetical protein GCM10007092_18610 [Thermus composti]